MTEGPGPLERDISEKLASGVTWWHAARTKLLNHKLYNKIHWVGKYVYQIPANTLGEVGSARAAVSNAKAAYDEPWHFINYNHKRIISQVIFLHQYEEHNTTIQMRSHLPIAHDRELWHSTPKIYDSSTILVHVVVWYSYCISSYITPKGYIEIVLDIFRFLHKRCPLRIWVGHSALNSVTICNPLVQ